MAASGLRPRVLATGLGFPEGPAVHADGDVYFVEVRRGCVSRWNGQSLSAVADTGGGPNGSAFGPDGLLYVANNGGFVWKGSRAVARTATYVGGWIERIDASGHREVVVRHYLGEPLSAPNDLAFDNEGNLYFTDPGFGDFDGRIYFMTPGGGLNIASQGYKYCNGLAFNEDGSCVMVAESYTGRLLICDVEGPGRLGRPYTFAELPDGYYPDGLAFDSQGHLLAAGAAGGAIHVFDKNGNAVEQIQTEDKFVTNLAFGGPSGQTLYATESRLGRLIAIDWPVPGLTLFPHRENEAA